ncbi:protein BEAN1 [Protopterus annectens]|uniref:protein BEAN1 n=1 Tax=Protopterus annectens TaxID=7888 RepID=UPI001CF9C09F|nr:protein BEAN1 [Protopterus annectens]
MMDGHALQPNQSKGFTVCESFPNSDPLLVSPLVVAGIVIGLVLFLSCMTIIVGSLKTDSRLSNPHLQTEALYATDSYCYGSSSGELRPACIEVFPPYYDFDSFVESLTQVNVIYPDSPPCYEESVGLGGTQRDIPTHDPPPYSANDPYLRSEMQEDIGHDEENFRISGHPLYYLPGMQELQHPIPSIFLPLIPLEDAPPYETVAGIQNTQIPLIPQDVLKNSSPEHHPILVTD